MWKSKSTDGNPPKTIPVKLMDAVVHCAKISLSLGLAFMMLIGGLLTPSLWEDPSKGKFASGQPVLVEPIYDIQIREDHSAILVRTRGSVLIRDLDAGEIIHELPAPQFLVHDSIWVPHSRRILVGCDDGRLLMLESSHSSEVIFSSRVHEDSICSTVVSTAGTIAATGSSERICLWDVTRHRMIAEVLMEGVRPNQLQFSPDGAWLLAGCDDGSLRLFRAKDLGLLRHFQTESACLAKAKFIEHGQKILVGNLDGTAFTVDSSTGQVGWSSAPCFMQLLDMAVSPDHRFVAFTDWSMSIHLYSLATFEKITSLKGHAKAVSTLRFSETEPWLFSGSHDGTVRIWDLQSFAELACYQGSRPNDED